MNWRNVISPLIRLYWRVVKPKTYGVKALVLHPDGSKRVLLVRHSYGNLTLWNLPGGGFNPKKESPIVAAVREVQEELNAKLVNPSEFYIYSTQTEGKSDNVFVILGEVSNEHFKIGNEIADYRWVKQEEALEDGENVARVARNAIKNLNA